MPRQPRPVAASKLRAEISYAVTYAALAVVCVISFIILGSYGWAVFGCAVAALLLAHVVLHLRKLAALEDTDEMQRHDSA